MTESTAHSTTGTIRFARVADVVWRSAPDRILIQRITGPPEVAAIDLIGDVAFVWIALDTPAARNELGARLADAGIDVDDLGADLDYLVEHRLIAPTSGAVPST
jgi:hypothetical protein